MPRFLHFADLHIDHASGGPIDPETGLFMRVLDMVRCLDQLVEYALDQRVDFVLFAGDAYHRHAPRQEHRALLHSRIRRLTDTGIDVYMVVGNHDKIKRSTSKDALHEFKSLEIGGVYVLDTPEIIERDDCWIAGIPWQYGPFDVAGLVAAAPGGKPGVAGVHATVWGAEYQSGGEATSEMELGKDFVLHLEDFEPFSYVGLGHIHRPQVLCENPPVIYPGSVGYHTWGEVNDSPHGFEDVTLAADGAVTWQHIPWEDRPRYDIFVGGEEEGDVLGSLPADVDPEGMYRITVDWTGANHRASPRIERAFAGAFSLQIRERAPRAASRRVEALPDLAETSTDNQIATYLQLVGVDFDEELKALWTEIREEVEDAQ